MLSSVATDTSKFDSQEATTVSTEVTKHSLASPIIKMLRKTSESQFQPLAGSTDQSLIKHLTLKRPRILTGITSQLQILHMPPLPRKASEVEREVTSSQHSSDLKLILKSCNNERISSSDASISGASPSHTVDSQP